MKITKTQHLILSLFLVLVVVGWSYISNNISEEVNNTANNTLPFSYSNIHLTRHAKERMSCRHIELREIEEILKNGTINQRKSEIQSAPCQTKYAVEGTSSDGQDIRLIVAPCEEQLNIVTVIDTENNWNCD